MGLHHDSALGDGFEEIILGESALPIEVEELEGFEKECVMTDFGGGFKLNLLEKFLLESR